MSKLLHISANTFPPLNANHHHTKNIWIELAKGFDEYHIIARSETNKFSNSKEGNIHLHLLPKITSKSRIFFFTSFWMFWLIKKYEVTHLLSQCPIIGGFAATIASKIFHIPLMVEIHGDVYFKYLKRETFKNKIFSFFVKYSFNNATKIRSLSSAMDVMLKEYNFKHNICVVPNRVNLDLFNCNRANYELHKPIRIISIGRFVDQKGYEIAIRTIKKISFKFDIELYLIGGGILNDYFLKITKDNKNIKIIKWIKQKELKDLLKKSDIYIQPSKPFLGEAMPRTILEAMAMKLPVISTKIAAIPGVLNKENSILIEPNSELELEKAILKLIKDNSLRERIAKQGFKDVVEKYEWSKVFEKYRNEILSMKYENT